jgi:hypothetical protein
VLDGDDPGAGIDPHAWLAARPLVRRLRQAQAA